MEHNVFQQKPAFNVSVHGSLSILPCRLALTGMSFAPPGSAEDVRYTTSGVTIRSVSHSATSLRPVTG